LQQKLSKYLAESGVREGHRKRRLVRNVTTATADLAAEPSDADSDDNDGEAEASDEQSDAAADADDDDDDDDDDNIEPFKA